VRVVITENVTRTCQATTPGYVAPVMSLPADLEPAVRDPRKLRRTAWILVAIMVLGGWLVLKAYETWATRQAGDDRPAHIHQIRKERDLRVIRQDGKTADLFDLRGKVWVVHTLALGDPGSSRLSQAVMERLAAQYADQADFALVSLVLDPPPAEQLVATLASHAQDHGMRLPQWWLAANEAATTHKFVKTELRANVFPHQKDGGWIHDSAIVLIDRSGHVRRAVVPQQRGGQPYVATFDFEQAARWDAEGKKTGTDRSNGEELELLLTKTIDALLVESPEPQ
jgi:cytochrome oxidase Cu insertion factor (SCO1/SenC/PrrC family)